MRCWEGTMKRLSAWLVGPLLFASIVVGATPAAASTTVAGNYTAYGKWGTSTTYQAFSLTLYSNHTGTDHFNDTIVWSRSLKSITLVFDGGLWTYLGTKTRTGISSLRYPGTLSNINGGTGTWYAVKIA
jgi:hypothetical protein